MFSVTHAPPPPPTVPTLHSQPGPHRVYRDSPTHPPERRGEINPQRNDARAREKTADVAERIFTEEEAPVRDREFYSPTLERRPNPRGLKTGSSAVYNALLEQDTEDPEVDKWVWKMHSRQKGKVR